MEVFKAFPRDRIQQRFVEQITSTIQLLTVVEEVLVEVFKASPRDRAQQRIVEQISSFLQLLTVVEEVLVEVFTASPRDRAQQRFVKQKMSTFQFLTVVESWVMVFFRPHQLGLLMRALLFVAVVWARLVLLVTMPLAVLLLVARLVLLVTMHFVFWLLVASQFSSISASSSLILTANGSPKDMASPSWSSIPWVHSTLSSGRTSKCGMMMSSTGSAPMSLCSNLLVVQDELGRGWILTLLVDQASTGMRCGSRRRSLLAGSTQCGWVRGEGLGQLQWYGKAGFAGDPAPRAVPSLCCFFSGDDFRNGFWKNFTRRSSPWLSPYSAQCLVRHWIHAVWYVAMCVSTAPVAEPS